MKIYYYSIVLIFSVTLWGCSNANSSAPAVIDQTTGKHAAGWAANGSGGVHPQAYFNNPSGCQECHGTDLKGGISQVSCSNPGRSGVACHAEFPPNHGPDFANFTQHGNTAKAAPGDFTGMGHCRLCHGAIYTGNPPAPSCIACHKLANASNDAPHAANWVSGNVNGLKHSTTDSGNAPACFQCHAGGKYSHPAPVPAPAGTAPGCFNGTMCHNAAGHTFTVVDHMVPASQNLASCQVCHATPATGSNPRFTVPKDATLTPNGCENCHNRAGLAHPYMWLPGRGGSPSSTPEANHGNAQNIVASCGMCHGGAALTGGGPGTAYPGGIAPPSCFSTPAISIGTGANLAYCHFTKPINAGGTTVGCISCHGAPPNSANPPTSGSPNRDYRHSKHWALPGMAAIPNYGGCATCHNGAGSGTLLHANGVLNTSSPFAAKFRAVSTSTATYDPATGRCTNISCHGGQVFPTQFWTNALPVLDPADPTTCLRCHRVVNVDPATFTGPYIYPVSGNNISSTLAGLNLHKAHIDGVRGVGGITCTQCHNLSVHFNRIMLGRRDIKIEHDLTAPSVGAKTGSVGGTDVSSYTYFNPTSSSCVNSCHGTRSWYK